MKTIEIIDVGDTVLCDLCNEEHTAEKTSAGGLLLGSYAYCPKCLIGVVQHMTIAEQRKACHAGPTETFHDFVMRMRGGDNLMTITSYDP